MIAAEIAATLGGARREGRGWRCCCPVHGGRSLVVSDGRKRLLVKCWGGGCDTRDILAELRRRGLIADRAEKLSPLATMSRGDGADSDARGIEIARRIWDRARDARG